MAHPSSVGVSAAALAAAMTAIALAGGLLRWWNWNECLWIDELHTAWTVAEGPAEIARRAAMGNQGPVYFYLPWISQMLFGQTEAALRLPSLFCGVLLIPLTGLLLVCWTRSGAAGLLAAALVALDSHFIFYAHEARAYAIVQVVGLLQIWTFRRLLDDSGRTLRLAFVALSAGLFHLHYTAALVVVAEIVYLGAAAIGRRRHAYPAKRFSVDFVAIALLWLPSAGHLQEVFARRANWALFVPRPDPADMVEVFSLGRTVLLPIVVLAAAAAVRLRQGHSPLIDRPDRKSWTLTICLLTLPLLIAWTATWFDWARIFLYRYLIVSAIAPILLCGIICSLGVTRLARLAVASVVIVAALWQSDEIESLVRQGKLPPQRRENWRGAVDFIRRADPQGELPVLVQSGLIESTGLTEGDNALLRSFCLMPVTTLYNLDDGRRLAPLAMRPELSQENDTAIRRAGGAWLLVRGTPRIAKRVAGAVCRELEQRGASCNGAGGKQFGVVFLWRLSVERFGDDDL